MILCIIETVAAAAAATSDVVSLSLSVTLYSHVMTITYMVHSFIFSALPMYV